MSVAAVTVGAISFGKVEAGWGSLWRKIVRQVASISILAETLQQIVETNRNLGRIVSVATFWALVAGSYRSRLADTRLPPSLSNAIFGSLV